MGMGLAILLVAVGGASFVWALTHITSAAVASGAGGATELAPTRPPNGRPTESVPVEDEAVPLEDEVARLRAALERVTNERDDALQELAELQDRWSW
jgi:hypothetical protein